MAESSASARRFLAIVGSMPRLAFPRRNPVEIGPVAIERLSRGERIERLAGEVAVIAWAKPNS
jgi:hypothetical protein